jgi:hypothetical protein
MLSVIIKDREPRIRPAAVDETCTEESYCEVGLKCPTKKAADPAKQDIITALDKKCLYEFKCDTTDKDADDNEFTYKCVKEAGSLRHNDPCTANIECMVEYRCAKATVIDVFDDVCTTGHNDR